MSIAVFFASSDLADKSWSAMDPAERGRMLNRMAQATYANAKALAAIGSNNGKTFREALSEIRYGAWTFEYFAGLTDKIEGSTIPVPTAAASTTRSDNLLVLQHTSFHGTSIATRTSLDCTCT